MIEDNGVLLIGIDSASADLLFKWQNKLPNCQKLIQNGVGGVLKSTVPPFTPPAWTAILTGKNPGKTGILGWINPKSNFTWENIKTNIVSFDQVNEPTIWDYVGREGRKSCVINVPLTYPPRKMNGMMVSGLPGHMTSGIITYPPLLESELDGIVDAYKILPLVDLSVQNREEEYVRKWNEILDKRLKSTLYLLEKDKWAFFMVVFYVLDSAQHYLWHHMDKTHPRHNDQSKKYENLIFHFYKKIDKAIGKILARIGRKVNTIIVSDHGMGPLHGEFMVNNFLRQQSSLKIKRKPPERGTNVMKHMVSFGWQKMRELAPDMATTLFQHLPRMIKESFSVRGEMQEASNFLDKHMNKEESTAYAIGEFGQIYVKKDNSNKQVQQQIKKAIMQVVEKSLKKNCKFFRKEDLYSGKYTDILPDLTYQIDNNRIKMNPKLTSQQNIFSSPSLTGYHNRNGIFIARGPQILSQEEKKTYNIYDVMPTILSLLKIPPPLEVDGKPLTSIFKDIKPHSQKNIQKRLKKRIKRLKDQILEKESLS